MTWCVSSVLWLMFDGTEACLYAGRVSVASRRCFMGVPWMVHEDLTSTCPLREAVPPLTIICHAVRMYDRSGAGMGVARIVMVLMHERCVDTRCTGHTRRRAGLQGRRCFTNTKRQTRNAGLPVVSGVRIRLRIRGKRAD